MSIAFLRVLSHFTNLYMKNSELNSTLWIVTMFALAELLFACFTYHLARNILQSFQQSKKHKTKK